MSPIVARTLLPLCYEEKSQNLPWIKQKIIKNPRHTKCLKKVKTKL